MTIRSESGGQGHDADNQGSLLAMRTRGFVTVPVGGFNREQREKCPTAEFVGARPKQWSRELDSVRNNGFSAMVGGCKKSRGCVGGGIWFRQVEVMMFQVDGCWLVCCRIWW